MKHFKQSAQTENGEINKMTGSEIKRHLGFRKILLIFLIILIAAAVMVYTAKIYLNKLAISSQPRYEQICLLLAGKEVFGQTRQGQEIDCVSNIFLTSDGLKGCNRDDDCRGVCVRFIPASDVDYGYGLGMTGPSFSGSCSEGIRLLPKFRIRF
ncbi:hypothetical protein KKF05_04375 [Patescibacteria group bacterium]|nr:hypothetical protein [Patescibacteria group bacterium]MBU1029179.1 hypothetical protein [Patescibacteria group bacterium]